MNRKKANSSGLRISFGVRENRHFEEKSEKIEVI